MKNADQINSPSEEIKNVIVTSIAMAALGIQLAYGFEIGIVVGLLAGAAFGVLIRIRISRKPPKMRYPMALFRRILMAATFLLLSSFGYSYLLDQ